MRTNVYRIRRQHMFLPFEIKLLHCFSFFPLLFATLYTFEVGKLIMIYMASHVIFTIYFSYFYHEQQQYNRFIRMHTKCFKICSTFKATLTVWSCCFAVFMVGHYSLRVFNYSCDYHFLKISIIKVIWNKWICRIYQVSSLMQF